jgi:hypothetical protein
VKVESGRKTINEDVHTSIEYWWEGH